MFFLQGEERFPRSHLKAQFCFQFSGKFGLIMIKLGKCKNKEVKAYRDLVFSPLFQKPSWSFPIAGLSELTFTPKYGFLS